MSQLKQNIIVVAILFLSLLSSVALSYMMTPNQATLTEQMPNKTVIKTTKKVTKESAMNQAIMLLLPKV